MIGANVERVLEAAEKAANKSGRSLEDITIIGVTKNVEPARIRELIRAGITNIGENRVQEFLPKYEVLKDEKCTFHFIGHLQRNKVKFVTDKVEYIHSVDSLPLAKEINQRANGKKVKILLEINLAEETTKIGVLPKNIYDTLEELTGYPFLKLVGLMCIPPMVVNPENNRRYFESLRKIFVDIKGKFLYYADMKHLSMGMTGDFTVAIEEGATMVRIGSGFFGERL